MKNNKYNNDYSLLAKQCLMPIQRGLQKFSNNIFIKSMVGGFVSAMPIILVSSIFILSYALPEAFVNKDGYDLAEANPAFRSFKAFAVRTYQFTYGILGLVVTGNIARALMEELNVKLPFAKRVKTFNVLICAMVVYFILAAVPGTADGSVFDPANDAWFDTVGWMEMGAQGVLPGILIGFLTPYIFFWCYKYNITIRLPKSVPGVISQSFLAIIPFFFSIMFWAGISYIFIFTLHQPFIPWVYSQLGGFIPTGIDKNAFEQATEAEKQVLINTQLNSFSNSYGIIILYRFLETFSWFIGVHPEAIQGIFENIMYVNQEMNATLDQLRRPESFAFVQSLMGPMGNMGGTGSSFVVPIICLLFCRSSQSKVAGKTSAIPVFFQVNEPILFGLPCILNPYMFIPFIGVPMLNSSIGKMFVDGGLFKAAMLDVPWATPWFIRAPLAQNFQANVFLCIAIGFACAMLLYLPFVLAFDRSLLKQEIQKNGKENMIIASGVQIWFNKSFNFDYHAWKEFKKAQFQLLRSNKQIDGVQNELLITEKRNELYKGYLNKREKSLLSVYDQIEKNKSEKALSVFLDEKQTLDRKLELYQDRFDKHNAKIDLKIENNNEFKEFKITRYKNKIDQYLLLNKENPNSKYDDLIKKYQEKIEWEEVGKINKLNSKKWTSVKTFTIKKDEQHQYEIKKAKIALLDKIKKYKLDHLDSHEVSKEIVKKTVQQYKNEYQIWLKEQKEVVAKVRLIAANEKLALNQNPYNLDEILNEEENGAEEIKIDATTTNNNETPKNTLKVLVLCIGAGTSAILANTIMQGAKKETKLKIEADALAYDSYQDALKDTDIIITSPQLKSYLESIKKDAKAYAIPVYPTNGRQYIELCNDPEKALQFVKDAKKESEK
ncbi:MAG: PTS transporter subunit EIIC [Mycoplasmoidaceae bacterium]